MLRTLVAVGALLMAGLLVDAEPAHADYVAWGSVHARNQKLRPGCHGYAYTYRVHPPTDNWSAELFLVGPRGGKVGSATYVFNTDPAAARAVWRLCRARIVAGRYKIRMKVSYVDGYDLVEGWVAPMYFRLSRR